MKLKQLEGHLSALQRFSNPKLELEQYPTWTPRCFSHALHYNSFGEVSDKVVADFDCGPVAVVHWVLQLHSWVQKVIGIDIDAQSLEIAAENAEDLELDMEFIQCNIKNLGWRAAIVDTVVMNPPFGTRKKGADMDFLSVALKIATQAVYSLHKTSTRDHVKGAALQSFNASSAEVIRELRYDVPQLYKFHKKREVDIYWTCGDSFQRVTSTCGVCFSGQR